VIALGTKLQKTSNGILRFMQKVVSHRMLTKI